MCVAMASHPHQQDIIILISHKHPRGGQSSIELLTFDYS